GRERLLRLTKTPIRGRCERFMTRFLLLRGCSGRPPREAAGAFGQASPVAANRRGCGFVDAGSTVCVRPKRILSCADDKGRPRAMRRSPVRLSACDQRYEIKTRIGRRFGAL